MIIALNRCMGAEYYFNKYYKTFQHGLIEFPLSNGKKTQCPKISYTEIEPKLTSKIRKTKDDDNARIKALIHLVKPVGVVQHGKIRESPSSSIPNRTNLTESEQPMSCCCSDHGYAYRAYRAYRRWLQKPAPEFVNGTIPYRLISISNAGTESSHLESLSDERRTTRTGNKLATGLTPEQSKTGLSIPEGHRPEPIERGRCNRRDNRPGQGQQRNQCHFCLQPDHSPDKCRSKSYRSNRHMPYQWFPIRNQSYTGRGPRRNF